MEDGKAGKEEPQPGLSGQGWLHITEEWFRDTKFHHPLERSGECFVNLIIEPFLINE